ncbi:EEP domain-containing protein [Phyllobacterium salinisoli]|uniref:EEP domain-containing protein n=1 Tax=Phyllobacterium salinisoli TaxID=1899321 RepID=A0A368K905_9HYPH|nr:endonuclease/exonuclease/phosphatase family protein [Phyllobacterium salinisoli]RCS25095.1 EEP domain-containing protein [Phyllobacterium salinisoli]
MNSVRTNSDPSGISPCSSLKVLTYNVHSCRGTDGKVDPARIAKVIAHCSPDIIALQEVDVGRARTQGIDQARIIASHLRMEVHFHPALHLADEQYGDAILTALPSRLIRAGPLPSIGEPRGAIWVSVDLGGTELHVINTHLGLRRRERMNQVVTLLGPSWLGNPVCQNSPFVLLGDFNARPSSLAYRTIARQATDVQLDAKPRPQATFPSRFPLLRLDYIFVGNGIVSLESQVWSNALTRSASDHLPLAAKISVPLRPLQEITREGGLEAAMP